MTQEQAQKLLIKMLQKPEGLKKLSSDTYRKIVLKARGEFKKKKEKQVE